jgi:hypothetical protein
MHVFLWILGAIATFFIGVFSPFLAKDAWALKQLVVKIRHAVTESEATGAHRTDLKFYLNYASELQQAVDGLRWYFVFKVMLGIPSKARISSACQLLPQYGSAIQVFGNQELAAKRTLLAQEILRLLKLNLAPF